MSAARPSTSGSTSATRGRSSSSTGSHARAPRRRGGPDPEPKASETVAEIVALIEELIARGLAYEVEGDVYFRVAGYADYGRLSGQRPDQVEEQEPNPLKEDARDFALWKRTKPAARTRWP